MEPTTQPRASAQTSSPAPASSPAFNHPSTTTTALRNAQSNTDIIANFGPTLDFAIRCQRILSAVSVFLVIRTYFLAAVTATTTLFASRVLAVRGYMLARSLFFSSLQGVETIWKSKTVRRMRKKMEFEIAMSILGPGTNAMIVLVFWPGWWVLAVLAVAAKMILG